MLIAVFGIPSKEEASINLPLKIIVDPCVTGYPSRLSRLMVVFREALAGL